jgi:hypothetical protein
MRAHVRQALFSSEVITPHGSRLADRDFYEEAGPRAGWRRQFSLLFKRSWNQATRDKAGEGALSFLLLFFRVSVDCYNLFFGSYFLSVT